MRSRKAKMLALFALKKKESKSESESKNEKENKSYEMKRKKKKSGKINNEKTNNRIKFLFNNERKNGCNGKNGDDC